MKIAYIITRMDEFGGAQVHVRDLCLWLKGQGHEPFVVSGWPGKVSDMLESQGVLYAEISNLERPINPAKDIKAFRQIRKCLKDNKPDIVACHSSKAGILGRLAAWSLGIPVVFTAHGWAFTDGVPKKQRILYRVIEKIAALFSSHIITVSEYDRNLALKYRIIKPEKISAIWNGMPMLPPERKDRPEGSPTRLLMVARVGPQKDHMRLIRALWGCTDLNWTLDLAGGGDDLELRQSAGQMQLSDRINFLGERLDIPFLMQEADLFVLTSNWEGLPLTIIEAMGAGLPVIATDVGGVGELIEHGKTGYLVPPNSDDQLLKRLKELIPDAGKLRQMGRAGRKRYEDCFTFSTMAHKTLAVYEHVLSRKNKH